MEHALNRRDATATVRVSAPARLHLGFVDMSGALGRRFGSLGLAIDGFETRLRLRRAERVAAFGPSAERARRCAERLLGHLGLGGGVEIRVEEAIPGHSGLGSGTQMALAVGTGIGRLFGVTLSTREIARILDRGSRSGIGIGAFDQGGFLLDGGCGPSGDVPPVISRMPYPAEWRAILVLDGRDQGLHGSGEVEAFRRLPPFPPATAAHLCQLALMQVLPALAEGELEPFARGVAELQRTVGDHFAPAQGGRFTSAAVAAALAWAEAEGFVGVGQSSWGPTGFILTPDAATANALVRRAKHRFGELSPLRFRVVAGANHGCSIERERAGEPLTHAH